MKTLFTLMLLTFSLSAEAAPKVIASLRLDLDQDGKADLVRIVDYGKNEYDRLEIYLTSSRQMLSFDHVVHNDRWNGQSEKAGYRSLLESYDDEKQTFHIDQSIEKRVGDTEVSREFRFEVKMINGVLSLANYGEGFTVFYIADASRDGNSANFNFEKQEGSSYTQKARNIKGIFLEDHTKNWKFEGQSCQVSLAEFTLTKLPDCAREPLK